MYINVNVNCLSTALTIRFELKVVERNEAPTSADDSGWRFRRSEKDHDECEDAGHRSKKTDSSGYNFLCALIGPAFGFIFFIEFCAESFLPSAQVDIVRLGQTIQYNQDVSIISIIGNIVDC